MRRADRNSAIEAGVEGLEHRAEAGDRARPGRRRSQEASACFDSHPLSGWNPHPAEQVAESSVAAEGIPHRLVSIEQPDRARCQPAF